MTSIIFLTGHQALPPGFHSHRTKGVAIATDIDDGSRPTLDLPPPSKAGAVDTKSEVEHGENGHAPGDKGVVMGPDTTGWAPRIGWPKDLVEEVGSIQDHVTWLEGNLPDRLYGGKSSAFPWFYDIYI